MPRNEPQDPNPSSDDGRIRTQLEEIVRLLAALERQNRDFIELLRSTAIRFVE